MRRAAVAVAALLGFTFVVQCVAFVRSNAQTYDEGIMLAAGVLFWRKGRVDVNGEHPPLAKAIAALPVVLSESPRIDESGWLARHESGFALGRGFLYEGGVPHRRLLALGRAPMVGLATALVGVTALWAWRLFGPQAGVLALALAAFDPNLVAYGSLIGNDAPLALFSTLAFFGTWGFFERGRFRWLALAGVATGLALVTKFSGILLAPLLLGAFAARAVVRRSVANAGVAVAVIFGLAAAVVGVMYRLHGYGAYLAGVGAQMVHQDAGHRAFLMGHVSSRGWAMYFPLALVFKCPPLTLALFVASLARPRQGTSLGRAAEAAVLPAAGMLAALTQVHVDIGVRYALPVVPLFIVVASRVATWVESWPRAVGGVLALGIAQHAFAAVRVAPHDLAFFSDVVGGPSRGHLYLSDSNLDWGQDLTTLASWIARVRPERLYLAYFGTAPPEAYGVTSYQPAPNSCPHLSAWKRTSPIPLAGREFLAISAMNEQGVFFQNPRSYQWLDKRVRVASLGHSIDVYEITKDADAHRALAALYERYGPGEFQADEIARANAIEAAR